jgi:hypothetical protein
LFSGLELSRTRNGFKSSVLRGEGSPLPHLLMHRGKCQQRLERVVPWRT